MDRERIEDFLARFVGFASGATTMGLLAIADRCGLLAWMAERPSGTVEEIAGGADLDARYVEEVLSGLAAAGVVEYEPGERMFTLPPEHALFLASDSSPYCMGGWLDMVPLMLGHVDRLAEAARRGGGIPFADFGEEMVEGIDRGNSPSQRVFLIQRWLPAVPGLIDRLTEGIRVADIGCGSGTAAMLIADAFPESEVTGFDVSEASLATARERGRSLPNVDFERSPASAIPLDPPYDLITAFDVIHDLADPSIGLRRIHAALGEGGRFLMMEPNASSHLENNLHDNGALLYGVSTMLCMTQSLAAGGEGVGASWGREKTERYAREAGFSRFEPLEGITNRFSAFYLLER